jgi:hypothetical protein
MRSWRSRSQLPCQARVERIAQAVAQQVDGQHRGRQQQPGYRMMWNATVTKLRPSAIMFPQLGVCDGTPTPRNDSAASVSTAAAATKVACTTSGATMLGSTWRSRMTGSRVPTACAAST